MHYKQQLRAILSSADWTQEQLAHQLGVSFPALNAWLRDRAVPRSQAQERIDQLYVSIVGSLEPDDKQLAQKLAAAQQTARAHRMTAKKIVNDAQRLERLTLHLTYHTNTIEGSTMTMADVENLIFKHKVLANRTVIEQAEAQNHQTALYWLLDQLVQHGKQFTIDEDLICGLHLRLMNSIIGDAGQYRQHSVRIMGNRVPLANWQKIPDLMAALCSDLRRPTQPHAKSDIVSQLAHTHAAFEKIHPFSDGNGRTGRLLMLAQALHAGYAPPLVLKDRKHAYYTYLQHAQTTEDIDPLALFIAESMDTCYELLK